MGLSGVKYLESVNGILKISQLVLSIIAFGTACAVADRTHQESVRGGYGWASFVAIVGFLMALSFLLAHVFDVSVSHVVEHVLYSIWTLCFLISGIVTAAIRPNPYWDWGYSWDYSINPTSVAACVFAFFCFIVWAIEVVLLSRGYQATATPPPAEPYNVPNTVNNDVPKRFDEAHY